MRLPAVAFAFASAFASAFALIGGASACGGARPSPQSLAPVPKLAREGAPPAAGAEPQCAPPPKDSVVLAFAGDVIAHDAVREAAARGDGGYAAMLAGARPALEGVDAAFVNLETPIAERVVRRGPMIFNGDDELLAALGGTGFDVLWLANNHAFDQGRSGLVDTLAATARRDFVTVGAGPTLADACGRVMIERGGIKIALLARTLVMNFHDGGERGAPDVCMLAEGPLKRAARAARTAGADLVVASLHWGNEYEGAPRREQVDAAHRIVEAGVDLVIGHHPHVLQRVERVRTRRGLEAVVAYSLGNLLSNQGYAFDERKGVPREGDTRDGAVLRIVARKRADGGVTIDDVTAVPLWTHRGDAGEIAIVPATSRRARIAKVLGVPLVDPPPPAGKDGACRAMIAGRP